MDMASMLVLLAVCTTACDSFAGDESKEQFVPIAGACIHAINPGEILEQVEAFGRVSGGKRSLYWDLKKNIERRFSVEDHLPFQKGRILVASDQRLESIDFDFVLDEAGAIAHIDEFAHQWKAPEPVSRPNYETKLEPTTNHCWVLSVSALSWAPKIPNDPAAEVQWERRESSTRKYFFRLQNGFLWSGRSEDVLQNTDFSRIPARLLTPESADSGRRLTTIWLGPDQVDLTQREMLLAELSRKLLPGMAVRDNENKTTATRRRSAIFLQWLLLRAVLVDCQASWLYLDVSEDGKVLFAGNVGFKRDSITSKWARVVGTTESPSLPKGNDQNDLRLTVKAAIPYGPFLWTPDTADEVPATTPVRLSAAVTTLEDLSTGYLELRLTPTADLKITAFQLPLVLAANFVSGLTGASQIPQTIVDQESIEILWGKDRPEPSEPRADQHSAGIELAVQRSFLQTIRRKLGAGKTVDEENATPDDEPASNGTPVPEPSSEQIALNVSLQPESLRVRFEAPKETCFELVALLFDAGIRF